MSTFLRKVNSITLFGCRNLSVSTGLNKDYSCKVLIVGGGSGGCTMAAKLTRRLRKDSIIVLEPSLHHYYQPLWTLVGAGVKKVNETRRPEGSVLPKSVTWLKSCATTIDPECNKVITQDGDVINYEYLVVAVGLINEYEKIPGLTQALEDPNSRVSTIYSPNYCEKTWSDIQNTKEGNAIFSFPDTPIKCPGAPQKIAYMADSYLSSTLNRHKTKLIYNTCLPVIFGVKKYADELVKVAKRKDIKVNYRTILREIVPERKEAIFEHGDTHKKTTYQYSMLHVTPPMRTPDFLFTNKSITDASGFLDVDKYTMQHKKYANIFGLGDCTNTPNSKTAAAIAKQSYVLEQNLTQKMANKSNNSKYDGYGACPLVTEYGKCIMAEFLYDGVVHETFPYNQAKESTIAYYMKRDLFPFLYWQFMLKGRYNGPEFVRKLINPFKT